MVVQKGIFEWTARLVVVVSVLLLTGCGSTPTASPGTPAPTPQEAAIIRVEQQQWQWVDGSESWTYRGQTEVPRAPAESWVHERGAIILNLKASEQLNLYDGKPHSLVLRVFQLNGPQGFNEQRKTRSGLQQLLAAGSDEMEALGIGIVDYQEWVIRPGEETTRILDRYAETRYLGLIAGYYDLERDHITRLVSFPALDRSPAPAAGVIDTLTFGVFGNEGKTADQEGAGRRPAKLELDLELASEGIGKLVITPF